MAQEKKTNFEPDWRETAPKEGTWRSIFKWGDPVGFKHPNKRLYELMKQVFKMNDQDFMTKIKEGDNPVSLPSHPPQLEEKHKARMEEICGKQNVSVADYERLKYSSGKTVEEALYERDEKIMGICDLVVHPRDKEDVAAIVAYCNEEEIPLYIFGAGSSVNMGCLPVKGGITIVLQTHMNKLLSVNRTNKTCRVQAGMLGPAYEEALNEEGYTCGHFPQSFEFSSVGGWIVTLGAGQQSTYFGDAVDQVVSMEWITPEGRFSTLEYPVTASGPRVRDMMVGSEGSFGVLVELTMKIHYHQPKNQKPFAFIFPSWEEGVAAAREISQGEFGFPGVMRLSDPEETSVGLKLYGIEGTILDTAIRIRGFKPMQRCLFLARTEGEKGYARNVRKKAKRICRRHGGMSLTGYPVKKWEHGRYSDPYMKEDMMDYGIIIDTLETGLSWDQIPKVHSQVREFVKSRPNTICMTHASHFYPQGTNLYFIYNGKFESTQEYVDFQTGIINAIVKAGGSLSHHHGVGRMIGPWMEEHLGSEKMGALRTLKRYFDPKGIMNPGGQLGLDYRSGDLNGKDWRTDWKKRVTKPENFA